MSLESRKNQKSSKSCRAGSHFNSIFLGRFWQIIFWLVSKEYELEKEKIRGDGYRAREKARQHSVDACRCNRENKVRKREGYRRIKNYVVDVLAFDFAFVCECKVLVRGERNRDGYRSCEIIAHRKPNRVRRGKKDRGINPPKHQRRANRHDRVFGQLQKPLSLHHHLKIIPCHTSTIQEGILVKNIA